MRIGNPHCSKPTYPSGCRKPTRASGPSSIISRTQPKFDSCMAKQLPQGKVNEGLACDEQDISHMSFSLLQCIGQSCYRTGR